MRYVGTGRQAAEVERPIRLGSRLAYQRGVLAGIKANNNALQGLEMIPGPVAAGCLNAVLPPNTVPGYRAVILPEVNHSCHFTRYGDRNVQYLELVWINDNTDRFVADIPGDIFK